MRNPLLALMMIAAIATTFAGGAHAQSGNPIAAIQQQLDSIATQLNQISTPPAAVSSGLLFRGSGDQGLCVVANVGVSQVTVHYEVLNSSAAVVGSGQATLSPGRGTEGGAGEVTSFRCRFTVDGGTTADIRAQAELRPVTVGITEFSTKVISEAR